MRRIAQNPMTIRHGLASAMHQKTALETALVESEWADANVPDDATVEEREIMIRTHFDRPREKKPNGCGWRGWNNGRVKKPVDNR